MTADFCNKICTFETSTGVRYTAASLIGRSGSSTLRPSTTPMSLSLAGSRFSSDTTPGALPSWNSRTRHNNLSGGLAVRRTRGHNPTVTREGTWEELAQILAGDRTVGLFEHLRKFSEPRYDSRESTGSIAKASIIAQQDRNRTSNRLGKSLTSDVALEKFLRDKLCYDAYSEHFAHDLAEILRSNLPEEHSEDAQTLAWGCAENNRTL